jgi:hypothetical protein
VVFLWWKAGFQVLPYLRESCETDTVRVTLQRSTIYITGIKIVLSFCPLNRQTLEIVMVGR